MATGVAFVVTVCGFVNVLDFHGFAVSLTPSDEVGAPVARSLAPLDKTWSVGLDIGQRSTRICILDANGKTVKEAKVLGPFPKLFDALGALDHPLAVCYEASCGYGYLHDQLRRIARRVVVAHPGQLRLIFRSKNKNDRVDARKLAMLLLLDQVPTVHVPSVNVRSWRSFIEFRNRLITKRTRVKNGLRALLRSYGITGPTGQRLWTRRGLNWLAQVELPTSEAMLQRDLLLDELEQFSVRIKRVEQELDATARDHPGVYLLRARKGDILLFHLQGGEAPGRWRFVKLLLSSLPALEK